MKTPIITTALATIALLFSASASANFIEGELTFVGDFVPTGGDTLATATGIDFSNDEFLVMQSNGDFFDAGITRWSVGTINDFTFDQFPGVISPLWEIGGFAFTMTSLEIEYTPSGDIFLLTGRGTIAGPDGAGFVDTDAAWTLSPSTSGRSFFTFSSGVSVVEPTSIALIGLGLVGMGVGRRRRAA